MRYNYMFWCLYTLDDEHIRIIITSSLLTFALLYGKYIQIHFYFEIYKTLLIIYYFAIEYGKLFLGQITLYPLINFVPSPLPSLLLSSHTVATILFSFLTSLNFTDVKFVHVVFAIVYLNKLMWYFPSCTLLILLNVMLSQFHIFLQMTRPHYF